MEEGGLGERRRPHTGGHEVWQPWQGYPGQEEIRTGDQWRSKQGGTRGNIVRVPTKGGREVPYRGAELEYEIGVAVAGKSRVVDGVPKLLGSRGSVSVCIASMLEMISCQTKPWKNSMPCSASCPDGAKAGDVTNMGKIPPQVHSDHPFHALPTCTGPRLPACGSLYTRSTDEGMGWELR